MRYLAIVSDFNQRPREEGDYKVRRNVKRCKDFNPRPREEGDTTAQIVDVYICDFNPRPREEGDTTMLISPKSSAISIHALVKRAT